LTILTEVDPGLAGARLLGATLSARGPEGTASFRLSRPSVQSSEVVIAVDSPASCTLPRKVLAPELDAPHRVAAALESSRNDPPFDRALPHALWLLEGDQDGAA
jgi:hypothetical protein